MSTAIWQGTEWHETQASKDQGRKMLMGQGRKILTGKTTRGNKATQILELLTFTGDRETKEVRSGTKHIGATDLLKEMTRRRAANLDGMTRQP
jgi:hypothetical protein